MESRSWHVWLMVLGMSACSSAATPATAGNQARPSRNRDLIVQADMDTDPTLRSQSVLEVIRTLRPQFLNDHGTVSAAADPEAGKVHVSIDNGRLGELSELTGIHGNQIIEVRYLNAAQAMQAFGSVARRGPVILVKTVLK